MASHNIGTGLDSDEEDHVDVPRPMEQDNPDSHPCDISAYLKNSKISMVIRTSRLLGS